MGDQFKPDQRHLLQKAYGAFYWSINFGSFFSFILIPWIKNNKGYSWAFAVPGILMGLATIIFYLGTKYYVRVPPGRETKSAGFIPVLLTAYAAQQGSRWVATLNLVVAILMPVWTMATLTVIAFANYLTPILRLLCWAGLIGVGVWYLLLVVMALLRKLELPESFWMGARAKYSEGEISAARSVSPIMFVFALVPVFWCLFDQSNSTWVLQGTKMTPAHFLWFKIDEEIMQSANPALVMILVPLLTLLVYPRMGRFASPLRRMSFGMFLAAFSYVVVAFLQARIEAGVQMSVLWQTVPYIILTTAEVLISTTGLEFAFREAAPQLKSTIMSFWLLTVAFGNLVVTAITKLFSEAGEGHAGSVSAKRFLMYAGLTFVVAILFSIVSAFYRYRDEAAARGK